MTISTSSSADRRIAVVLLSVLLAAGCGPSEGASGMKSNRPVATRTAEPSVPATKDDIAALYTADLARAVAGAKKVPFDAKGAFGGMTCSPGTIDGRDKASRALTLTLPDDVRARSHVLAVVTPERGLLEIYSPSDGAADAEDIIVPSQTISWAEANSRRTFATTTDKLDGLRPGSEAPEVLFLEQGRYRFVLANGIDAGLLKANGAQVKVEAACSFDWTP